MIFMKIYFFLSNSKLRTHRYETTHAFPDCSHASYDGDENDEDANCNEDVGGMRVGKAGKKGGKRPG